MTSRVRQAKIVVLGIGAATAYGVAHDQVTVRLCPEYFTIAHPPLFPTNSLTLLGVCWGVAATFWVGVVLGLLLALVSQSAGVPPVPIARLVRLTLGLVAITALAATVGGILGYELSRDSILPLPAAFAEVVRSSRHHQFMAVWFAHGTSYLVGVVGAALVIHRIWRQRGRPPLMTVFPRTKAACLRAILLAAIVALIAWFRFR